MNGYDPSKPHKASHYPDSVRESKKVLRKMKNPDTDFYELTDLDSTIAFMRYMDEKGLPYEEKELKKIIDESYPIVKGMKDYYNRPRPNQVNKEIKALRSKTAQTPSYPAGHAFQSYLIAQHLSKKYPLHYFSFYSIANRIANARVSVGLHYPSDNKKAFELAHSL